MRLPRRSLPAASSLFAAPPFCVRCIRCGGWGIPMVLSDVVTADAALSYLPRPSLRRGEDRPQLPRGINNDISARALVAAILAMGHARGLEVVGEGVETADRLSMLRPLNFDLKQGCLFAEPEPARTARELLWKLAQGRVETIHWLASHPGP